MAFPIEIYPNDKIFSFEIPPKSPSNPLILVVWKKKYTMNETFFSHNDSRLERVREKNMKKIEKNRAK
jgi:hypothetical protein